MTVRVSIAKAKNQFSRLLKQARDELVIVTRRGEPDSVILPFEEYERLERLAAYRSIVRLSKKMREAGVTAAELYEASRRELEERG